MNNLVHKKAKNIIPIYIYELPMFTEKYKWIIAKHEKMFYYCKMKQKGRHIFAGRIHI